MLLPYSRHSELFSQSQGNRDGMQERSRDATDTFGKVYHPRQEPVYWFRDDARARLMHVDTLAFTVMANMVDQAFRSDSSGTNLTPLEDL